jgi:hypothetical protein
MRSVRHRVLLRLHWCVHSLHPSEALEKLACCIPSAPGHEPCMRMGEGCDDHARVCVDSDRLVDMHQLLIWKVRHSARCVAFVTPLSSRSMTLSEVRLAPIGRFHPCWYGSLDAVGKRARTVMLLLWVRIQAGTCSPGRLPKP